MGDEELESLQRLAAHLRTEGEVFEVLRRPDLDDRERRAVDFELKWNGRVVGLEVTSSSAYMQEFVEADRLESAIEARLRPFVEANDMGQIAIRYRYRERLRKREIEPVANAIVSEVCRILETRATLPARVPAPGALELVEVHRLGDAKNYVGRISIPVEAYFIDEEVLKFVDWLVEKKGPQGAAYSELWILIHQRTPMFSAEELQGGLAVSRSEFPRNWQRIFFSTGAEVRQVFSKTDGD